MDKEEIIRRLKKISEHAVHVIGEPPFIMGLDDGIALNEAVRLLKEQEAIEPEVEVLNEIDRLYRCPKCHKCFFYEKQKYCDQCGQKVKWE